MIVDSALYRQGVRVPVDCAPHELHDLRGKATQEGDFVWVGLHDPTEVELEDVAIAFGLHGLAVEDAVNAHQRPKLERYDDSLFTVFKTVHYLDHDRVSSGSEIVETGEVMCFTGRDFFITVRHGGQGSLRALRHRLQDDPELLASFPREGFIPAENAQFDPIETVARDLGLLE